MKVRILGTRGVPARHGGFETFAENLALYLVARGHQVTVYCQTEEEHDTREDSWRGIELVHFAGGAGPVGTILFDLKTALHALRHKGIILTLGYNTAIFSIFYLLTGRKTLMNMDGLEWMRLKWSLPQRMWLRANEYLGAKLSTHLIADHPVIGKHLEGLVAPEKISVIAYGAETMPVADRALLDQFGCTPFRYMLSVARAEPENSILEMVRAFSRRQRGFPLLVLGRFDPKHNAYHRQVIDAASEEVIFPGAIYDKQTMQALRQYTICYLHGHRVGGTNPSLVEALAAGNAVIAHKNPFNQWVAGPEARYFSDEAELDEILNLLEQHLESLERMRAGSRERHQESFQLSRVNRAYEQLLEKYAD